MILREVYIIWCSHVSGDCRMYDRKAYVHLEGANVVCAGLNREQEARRDAGYSGSTVYTYYVLSLEVVGSAETLL